MLALSAFLVAAHFLPEGKGHAVAWQDLSAQVGPLTIRRSDARVFRERSKLEKFLRGAHPGRALPPVDFSARELLLVSPGPRSSTGYSVEVLSIRERSGKITVRLREKTPALGEDVRAGVTYPYLLISLPADKDVFVDWVGR